MERCLLRLRFLAGVRDFVLAEVVDGRHSVDRPSDRWGQGHRSHVYFCSADSWGWIFGTDTTRELVAHGVSGWSSKTATGLYRCCWGVDEIAGFTVSPGSAERSSLD